MRERRMAIKDLLIKIGLKGDKKAERGIKKVDSAFGGLAKSAMKIGAVFYAAKGVITGLTKIVEISGKMQAVQNGFDNLTKSVGMSSKTLEKLQKATDGTVSSLDLMTQANNILLLDITKSEDEMAEMFDIAQRLGSALGKDTLFGVESLVTGMGRQSKLMLDNLGIMIDMEKANESHAKSLGKTVEQLTDAEKKQAFNNATMTAARGLVAKLGEENLTTADRMNILKSSATNTAAVLGDALTPAFNAGLDVMSDFSVKISDTVTALSKIDFKTTGENILKNTEALLTAFTETFRAYIDYIPDYWKNIFGQVIPIMGGILEKITNAVSAVAEFIWEPLRIKAEIIFRQIQNVFIETFNVMKEQFNKMADTWAGEKLGIERMEPSDLIDIEGLKAELGETGMSKLLDDLFTGEDNIQSLSDFTANTSAIWGDYFKTVAELAEETGVKTANVVETVGNATESAQKKMGKQIELAGALSTALQTTFDPDLGAGEAFKGFVIQLMSAMQGVILASKAVSDALTFTFTGPLGISVAIASLIALEAAKAGVRGIKFAETGFDGIVDKPTMFMTGEAGAERVQVTPLQGPNINGPQGGITLNISAPLVDETIVDSIIPAIQKAQRMNLA